MRASFAAVASLTVALSASCSTSTGGPDGSIDALFDTPHNACLAYGAGYICQSSAPCAPGYHDIQDLDCASTGELCCGPVLDGSADATPDVAIFVPDARFETGSSDAKKPTDGTVDSTLLHDGSTEAGHESGVEAGHHDSAADAAPHDAASDASEHHEAASDAKSG